MKLSVTLIVRNEEQHLKRLLPQLTFADEITVADTGSSDGTVSVAEHFGAKVYPFSWNDDFAAARNYAIARCTGEYIMWLDADDTLPVRTRKAICEWKKQTPAADVYYMKYRMDGEFPFWFMRERIVRNCARCRFRGFIHEAIVPFGRIGYLDCEVVHRPAASHAERNLAIYRKAIASGRRLCARDKYYYARTLLDNGLTQEAEPILRKVAAYSRADISYRADACRLLARSAIARGDMAYALTCLSRSVRMLPPDAETCCLFGQVYFDMGMWQRAYEWYILAKCSRSRSGFVNEYYSGFLPDVQLSVCCWHLGRQAEGRGYHLAARAIAPSHPSVKRNDAFFRIK